MLEDVNMLLPRREVSSQQRKALVDILAACLSLLNELQRKVGEYPELDVGASKRDEALRDKIRHVRKRLRWEPKDIEELRVRICSNVTLLNTFYAQLTRLVFQS